jgi:hypothetical protein
MRSLQRNGLVAERRRNISYVLGNGRECAASRPVIDTREPEDVCEKIRGEA